VVQKYLKERAEERNREEELRLWNDAANNIVRSCRRFQSDRQSVVLSWVEDTIWKGILDVKEILKSLATIPLTPLTASGILGPDQSNPYQLNSVALLNQYDPRIGGLSYLFGARMDNPTF
jgi:hypothetical protein